MFQNQNQNKNQFFRRTNYQIRVPNVRVFLNGNEPLGIMSTDEARKIAVDNSLDLVEVTPSAQPPVCHIIDYSKYKYDLKIKEKETAKRQRESFVEIKEIRLTPTIGEHDIETKLNHAQKFLQENKKVQFTMKFSHREMNHKDIGINLINTILEKMEPFSIKENNPSFNGNKLICLVAPKKI
jgi:translation initiation factor IF-3